MRNTNDRYIHPFSEEIREFVSGLSGSSADLSAELSVDLSADNSAECIIKKLLAWFDENISYSRLDRPFSPFQRSDLDLLSMKRGTCGDFSNLIVSCLVSLGVPAKYALVSRDYYGDPQDHICAAALIGGRWVLIDATLPYRKWFGYDCGHKEFELVEPDEFEKRMREIENECVFAARERMMPDYAGLLYAPWIHNEVLLQTENRLDSAFYLMVMRGKRDWTLLVTYMSYTKEGGRTPVLAMVSPIGEYYRFSVREPSSIWDENQWGEIIKADALPPELRSPELERLKADMEKNVPRIKDEIIN